MFAIISSLVILACLIANASAAASFSLCYPGTYCGTLTTQAGTYATPQACADQCVSTTNNKFFSYVPTSMQCLCSSSCDNRVVNPNVNSYCIGQSPTFSTCWTGKYCGPNSAIVTQRGLYETAQDCASQCHSANNDYKFFNLVPSTKQCQCLATCSSVVVNPNVNGYALNNQACPASLRH